MRRARSLFEIDQEPLFEPVSLEADDDAGAQGWDDSYDRYDDLPPGAATATRHAAEENSARLGGSWRSRVLVVVAAIGVLGFVGSRLTQVASAPSAAPRTAALSPLPVVAAPVGVTAQRRHAVRTRRAPSRAASRHAGASSPRAAVRSAAGARRASPPVTAPRPAVSAPAPPYAPPAPPEPQGFIGEFF